MTGRDDALARLTGPGGQFEIIEETVLGARMPVFRHRRRYLGELLAASPSHGDAEYLVTEDRRITFAEHAHAVAAVAEALSRRGVGRGDRVAILAANSPEWIVTFWATTSLGAVTAAYNAWWSPQEIRHALEHSAPTVLVVDAKRAEAVAPLDIPVLTIESDIAGLVDTAPPSTLRVTEVDEDDPAVIVYTSGTTGRSKGATHSHRNVLATVDYHRLTDALARATGVSTSPSDRRYLLSMPLFHIGSLHNLAVPRLDTGATVVLYQGAFDPARVLRLVARERVTNWTVVPTMASRLLEHGDLDAYDLSALTTFGLASAPSSESLKQRLRDALPAAEHALVDSYGLTESCTGATVATPEELRAYPGTVGRPVPTMRVSVRDEHGAPVPDGVDGEIWLRGPFVMTGYWNDPAATEAAFDDDRWLRTGDVGCLHGGRLYLTTRRGDLILRGGENVYPAEVEHCLDEHPAVRECAVLGVAHPDLGQEVAAIVVAHQDTVDSEELTRFARERLAYYKVPARWRITSEPLPRNAMGKVNRTRLWC